MKFYVCKRMRLLTLLQENGFKYLKQQKDRNNPRYSVWIFEDTPELRSTVESYYNSEEFIRDDYLRKTKETTYEF